MPNSVPTDLGPVDHRSSCTGIAQSPAMVKRTNDPSEHSEKGSSKAQGLAAWGGRQDCVGACVGLAGEAAYAAKRVGGLQEPDTLLKGTRGRGEPSMHAGQPTTICSAVTWHRMQ